MREDNHFQAGILVANTERYFLSPPSGMVTVPETPFGPPSTVTLVPPF